MYVQYMVNHGAAIFQLEMFFFSWALTKSSHNRICSNTLQHKQPTVKLTAAQRIRSGRLEYRYYQLAPGGNSASPGSIMIAGEFILCCICSEDSQLTLISSDTDNMSHEVIYNVHRVYKELILAVHWLRSGDVPSGFLMTEWTLSEPNSACCFLTIQ